MAVAQGELASRAEFKRIFQQFLRAEDLDSPYGQVRLRSLGTIQGWG